MAITLTLVGKTPGQSQFGLDTFTEHYKANDTADVVLTDASVPQKRDAHGTYTHMFVTDRFCSETGEKASALDLVYTGCLKDDSGNPVLPPQQNATDTQIQTASSSRSSTGILLTSPATIQFYAPSTILNYVTAGGPGTDLPADPATAPSVITWTFGDTSVVITDLFSDLVSVFFSVFISTSLQSTEIVAGQYWQNTARKTLAYVPYIFDVPSGPLVTLASPGNGYTAGDSLTISSGGENASITVDTVGGAWGGATGILSYHVTADTFTTAHTLLSASGGTGSGAKFNVTIIP